MTNINTKLGKMEIQILERFFSLHIKILNKYLFEILGLGTSKAKKAKEYSSNMDHHRIIFQNVIQ